MKRPAVSMALGTGTGTGTSTSTAGAPTITSPKITKIKLPVIQQQPAHYGCEHIGRMFEDNPETSKQSKQFYSEAARTALLDFGHQTTQDCMCCGHIMGPAYMCLQCPQVHCIYDAEAHFQEAGHSFGVESRNGQIYCFSCDDYVYDPTLEQIRLELDASSDCAVRKKRRLGDKLPPEDVKMIETHTIAPPCRTTGLRGFVNMGSTCFMSVVLQSLVHNPFIRNFYLSDGHKQKDCMKQDCLSCAMDEMFSEFFSQPSVDGFGPINLLTASWKCEQTLAGYQQQDAHEYLQFLLNQLHNTNCDSGSSNPNTNHLDCSCIIHRCFYGTLQSNVTCENCANVTTAFDPVMDLSLDLRIKARKKGPVSEKTLTGTGTKTMVQSLEECLARFTRAEKLESNEYNCAKCRCPREATKQLIVKQLPPVLCVQLKRFEHSASGSVKIEDQITFPMILDMTPYTPIELIKPPLPDPPTDFSPNDGPIICFPRPVKPPSLVNSPSPVNSPTVNSPPVAITPAVGAPTNVLPAVSPLVVDALAYSAPTVNSPTVSPLAVSPLAVSTSAVSTPAVTAPIVNIPTASTAAFSPSANINSPANNVPDSDVPAANTPTVNDTAVSAPAFNVSPAVPAVDTTAASALVANAPDVNASAPDVPAVNVPAVNVPAANSPTTDAPMADAPATDAARNAADEAADEAEGGGDGEEEEGEEEEEEEEEAEEEGDEEEEEEDDSKEGSDDDSVIVSEINTEDLNSSDFSSDDFPFSSDSDSGEEELWESRPLPPRHRPLYYDLINVVVHKGEINSGHYISYARHNGQWFQFDDSMVTLATEKQVLSAQAYLLFYITRTLN